MRIAENIPAYVKPGAVLKLAGNASFEAYTKPAEEEAILRGKDFTDYFLVLEVVTPLHTTYVRILDAQGTEWVLAILPDWPREELKLMLREELKLMLLVPESQTG